MFVKVQVARLAYHIGSNACTVLTEAIFFRKLSDNNHYDEVYITDEELVENFAKLGKYNALYRIPTT